MVIKKIIKLLRIIAVILSFALVGIGAVIISYGIFPFLGLVSKENKKIKYSQILQKSWQFFIWLLQFIRLIKINCSDIEKLKSIKNSIILSTHPSYIDIIILISIIPNTTCFVADRLVKNIFFKGMVKSLFISEGQPVDSWLNESEHLLNSGFNIIIFPMGIRHRKDEFPKIRRGAALLAQKTKRDIEIIRMETSRDFLQINQPVYDVGEDVVIYDLSYVGKISTESYLKEYPDEVNFKHKLCNIIGQNIYNIRNN